MRFQDMATGSASPTDPAALADQLHRLRSTMARLRSELDLLELDGRPPGREVFAAVDEAFDWLDRIEAASFETPVRVLVADDDERLAELTATRLQRFGFTVESAGELAGALDRLRPGDRLVVDYGMIASGAQAEVAAVLRECRAIVVSGAVSDAAREHALAMGAVAYLVKPVEMAELARLLRTPAAGRQ